MFLAFFFEVGEDLKDLAILLLHSVVRDGISLS